MARFILFDIDLTLIKTNGAGRHAMDEAFTELFGVADPTSGISFDGRTDRAIFTDALRKHGLGDDRYEECISGYLARLERSVALKGGEVLPGIAAVLDALRESHAAVGLATGNFRRGAELKLGHFGLWERFAAGGFGDGKLIRADVVAEGMRALAAAMGEAPEPSETLVIGDTPLDIEAAHAAGAKALGVATGSYSEEQLREAGAEFVLRDFSDVAGAVSVLRG